MSEPIASARSYLLVFAALFAATLLTVGAATADLGFWNAPVALLIAAIKATLVLLFFMHLRASSGLTWIVVVAGLLWLAILIVGTLDDYMTRGWIPTPGG